MTNPLKPLVAITQGDPAGIGPELCVKLTHEPSVLGFCRPLILGDRVVLEDAARRLGRPLSATTLTLAEFERTARVDLPDGPLVVDCACLTAPVAPGTPTRDGGRASYAYIENAIRLALARKLDAVTTAPITKQTLKMAGIDDPGHTEIFGRLTGSRDFAMMLYSPRLAVSFVTCHQSLRSVPDALRTEEIERLIHLTAETLRRIRGAEPRLAVLGLNPHAGEGGMFGDEDERIVRPAVEHARAEGWNVEGPIPPDAAFMPRALQRFDGHVTLYHDQGSIPFKMISLHDGVNITMGLPIIRTSVDHGTAYDIAGQGKADPSSLISAIELAARLAAPADADRPSSEDNRHGIESAHRLVSS